MDCYIGGKGAKEDDRSSSVNGVRFGKREIGLESEENKQLEKVKAAPKCSKAFVGNSAIYSRLVSHALFCLLPGSSGLHESVLRSGHLLRRGRR